MTTTQEAPAAMDPGELAGKTRAELLELCRARGLKATAWKRDRMFAALTGQDEPVPAPKKNVLSEQLEARRQEREDSGADARKALENRLKRNGACQSKNGCRCEAYEFERKDAFHWDLCSCGHTQWAHAVAEPAPAREGA